MPQLSPMSWVFVFSVFLVFFIWFVVVVWWSGSGEYSLFERGEGSDSLGVVESKKEIK
uniref:ATP synthase F0 subunit 8 n=1 Tax=Cumberlandia monodonta TaxID=52365 RepID=A0A1X9JPA5_CUMMO|nr:ATP synthase F0 subunit 8 [Cumberlandia monodonta]AQT38564.1 ATP synthase F0 subunit 8 [Cumberlandia monodonta]WGM81259.1 ATP synthase F0 subunit 8 [Cumberlandia monodonta]